MVLTKVATGLRASDKLVPYLADTGDWHASTHMLSSPCGPLPQRPDARVVKADDLTHPSTVNGRPLMVMMMMRPLIVKMKQAHQDAFP